jgi:type I restriction enzyme R subunit
MKQAVQEGFILDVLAFYTPVESYYRLVKKVDDDPTFDTKRAAKKLRRFVESHDHAIRLKAEIMVDHFHEQVLAPKKIGGEARAMIVTSGIERAIQYFHAVRDYLSERKSPFKAIVAFSGEPEYAGQKVSEASLNGFPSSKIAERIQEDPYRILICADKFQTGYDEPLLHTMYVDKVLSGIKAVQTLSRLNRARQGKYDTFVLDFMNDTDTIRDSFADYYRTTVLAEETDPNKLHDLQTDLDAAGVYGWPQIEGFVEKFLRGVSVEELHPVLDTCVAEYGQLDEDAQVAFKGNAKAFVRVYGFLSTVLPYANPTWEKLAIFLNCLVRKLPAPVEEDLSKGILDSIDMDSYRVEKRATMKIALADEDATILPLPVTGGGHKPEPELELLSAIIKEFNDRFGNIAWEHRDRIERKIAEEIPSLVDADPAYTHARKNSDRQNARIEHDKALVRVLVAMMKDETQLFKEFSDNPSFKRWLADSTFEKTYRAG